jgi:DNA-binding transcriptional regulator YiaG
MTTFAIVLKDEIRRLARKEIRAQTGKQARAVAQYRREIARLKRQQLEQEKKLARLAALARGMHDSKPADIEEDGKLRFSARSVRAQRRKTGLSAADYAKLVGVSSLTIYNWEHNKSRPRKGQFAALVALRNLGKREAQAKLSQVSASKKPGTRRRARKPK